MSNLFWTIYLIDIAGSIEGISLLLFSVLFIAFCIYSWMLFMDRIVHQINEISFPSKKQITIGIIFMISVTTICTAIPSKKSLYLMAAVKYSDLILAGRIPEKAVKLLDAKLDSLLLELQKDE